MLAAIFLRFSDLGWEEFSWNEGTLVGGALEYARGNLIHNFNDFATPPLMKYLGAFVYAIYGFSEALLRGVSAAFGTLTVLLTYVFVREHYGKYAAALSASIVAFSVVHLAFSRMFLAEAATGFFYLATLFYYFVMQKKPERRNILLFGISLGLALLSKYLALYLVVSLVAHALWKGLIKISFRKKLTLSFENYFLKGLIAAVLVFFILWPFSLYPVRIHFDVELTDFPGRDDSFTLNVPQFLLSAGEYSTAAIGREEISRYAQESGVQNNIITFPFVGYMFIFFAKESLPLLALFAAGLYAIFRKRVSIDKDILIFLLIFLLFLWNQKYGWSYRYLTPVIPLIAIVSARCLDLLKTNRAKTFLVVVASVTLFMSAVAAHPHYILSYSPLDNVSNFRQVDDEIVLLYGYREGAAFVRENCTKVAGELARSAAPPDADPEGFVLTNPTAQELPFCVYAFYKNTYYQDIEKDLGARCETIKEIAVDGLNLRRVYMCTAA